MVETRYTVEPVTQLALFRLGYRFLIVGPRGQCCWGFHRTVEEARQAVDRLNDPPPWPR